jgi:hypothetical protein
MSKLIPLSKLFGNPSKSDPKLSPDGKRFAYLANSEGGVLNVFVQSVGEDNAKQISNDTHRGIRIYEWAENNTHILYKQAIFQRKKSGPAIVLPLSFVFGFGARG